MKKYYIIREDGSSIFELPYPKDFCIHCLSLLIEDGQRYRLMSSDLLEHISLSAFIETELQQSRKSGKGSVTAQTSQGCSMHKLLRV